MPTEDRHQRSTQYRDYDNDLQSLPTHCRNARGVHGEQCPQPRGGGNPAPSSRPARIPRCTRCSGRNMPLPRLDWTEVGGLAKGRGRLAGQRALIVLVKLEVAPVIAGASVASLRRHHCLPRLRRHAAVGRPRAGRQGSRKSPKSTLWPILFRTDLSPLMVSVGSGQSGRRPGHRVRGCCAAACR